MPVKWLKVLARSIVEPSSNPVFEQPGLCIFLKPDLHSQNLFFEVNIFLLSMISGIGFFFKT
jgi:hypothetical protein